MKVIRFDEKGKKLKIVVNGLTEKQSSLIVKELNLFNSKKDKFRYVAKRGDGLKNDERIEGIYVSYRFDCFGPDGTFLNEELRKYCY